MSDIVELITDTNDKKAYDNAMRIVYESEYVSKYYEEFDVFVSLLINKKSYVRTRAFILCCSQAKWDTGRKIEKAFPDMMKLLYDPKPTVVRQCLKAVKDVIKYLPELNGKIKKELMGIDPSQYGESMSPLIQNDIGEVLKLLND